MKLNHKLRRVFAASLVCGFTGAIIATSPIAHADDASSYHQRIEIKSAIVVGQQASFDSDSVSDHSTTVTPDGQAANTIKQSSHQHRKGTLEVLEVKDGTPTALRIHFDDQECTNSDTRNDQKQDTPFPLSGKTVVVRLGADGQITTDAGNLDAQTIHELAERLQPDRSCLPPKPVIVGDEWAGNKDLFAQEMGLTSSDGVQVNCKLIKLDEVGGRKAADIAVTATVTNATSGITMKMDLKGDCQVDLATGQTLDGQAGGAMNFHGQTKIPDQNGGGITAAIDGSGDVTVHQSMQMGAASAPAESASGGNTAAPADTNAGNPLDPSSPAIGADADSKFTGIFSDGAIRVQLAGDGHGHFTGTVTVGANPFPATAQVQNGKLTGSFKSGDNSFDFTATVDGNVMKLTSSGHDHELKKAAAANPLSP